MLYFKRNIMYNFGDIKTHSSYANYVKYYCCGVIHLRTTNIISAYQSIVAIENAQVQTDKINKMLNLASHEAKTLEQFCNILISHKLTFDIFDGYYVGYPINQISKEFDLLRFSDNLVINIELKSELDISKVRTQMEQNYYYLNSINRSVLIYTYVKNDALYKYNPVNKQVFKVEFTELIQALSAQSVNYNINPDKLFIPSNYLISPFHSTQRFLNEEYFLNDNQQNIKNEILKSISNNKCDFFCISANAGTGKTLLMYDIAKAILNENKHPLVIHCGKLNEGQIKLINNCDWSIVGIGAINNDSISCYIKQSVDVIFIDESQRIRDYQLELILNKAKPLNIPIVFAYDKKQYLRNGETKDLYDYLKEKHAELSVIKKTLTNKIRTNEEMASFITNLFNIGKSNSNLNYENVTIEYFDTFENARSYMWYLCHYRGWKAITYTDSTRHTESISQVASICDSNAHDVIGQEFDKVVFVMDKHFQYNERGQLSVNETFYSVRGMLYQIVTRVVNELKIIVLNNPELYAKLLEIKCLYKHSNDT